MSSSCRKYGIRTCLFCQETFEAMRPGQVTCSEKCRIGRRKTLKKETRERNEELISSNLEWLNCKLEEMIGNNKKADNCAVETQKVSHPGVKKQAEKTDAKKIPTKKHQHICVNCGSTFRSVYQEDSYCCEQCAKEATAFGGTF